MSETHGDYDQNEETYGGEAAAAPAKRCTYYPSNKQGSCIKNAVTGVDYPWRVGSKASQRLFKVVDTLGTHNNVGLKIKQNKTKYPLSIYPNPNPNHCYYDSPQQFMTHRKMTVQPQLIAAWEARQKEFAEADAETL
jgi:hypothetical protein